MSGLVAIITARGGSKRLPGKNLQPLAGKPLVAHTIAAALGCSLITAVFVTTEDPAIRAASIEAGAMVLDRPATLATDAILSADVVWHALQELQGSRYDTDEFVLLQPTSPLRSALHITECIQAFQNNPVSASAVSVTELRHSPFKDFLICDGFLTPLLGKDFLSLPHQELAPVFRQNGAIYVGRCGEFLKNPEFCKEPCLPYIMGEDVSIDIDTVDDLGKAESLVLG